MRWRERLRDPAWDAPLIVSASAILALLVIATGAPPELRVPITLWFFLTGPGLALIPLLGLDDFKWVGVIAASLTVDVVVTELMLYTDVWSLSTGVEAILIICAIGVGLQVHRLGTDDIGLPAGPATVDEQTAPTKATGAEQEPEPATVDQEPEPAESDRDHQETPALERDDEPSVSVATNNTATERIDLNGASAAELQPVYRIGPVLAARIVDYREANGPFNDVQELLRVPGIGEAHLVEIVKEIKVL